MLDLSASFHESHLTLLLLSTLMVWLSFLAVSQGLRRVCVCVCVVCVCVCVCICLLISGLKLALLCDRVTNEVSHRAQTKIENQKR